MPVTTINRVIVLFLAGGFALLSLLLLNWTDAASYFTTLAHQRVFDMNTGFWAFGILLFTAPTVFLGLLIESITEITLHPFLKESRRSNKRAQFFARTYAQSQCLTWVNQLKKLLEIDPQWQWLREGADPKPEVHVNGMAAGEFLRTAGSDEYEWLQDRYATFYLSSNFALILLMDLLYIGVSSILDMGVWGSWVPTSLAQSIVVPCTMMLGAWLLSSFSVSKFLYSYEIVARHTYLGLVAARSKATPEGAQNPPALPAQPVHAADGAPRRG